MPKHICLLVDLLDRKEGLVLLHSKFRAYGTTPMEPFEVAFSWDNSDGFKALFALGR